MEILQGHDTWNWKGLIPLKDSLKDYKTFLKYKYTQIDEIQTFLEDPELLEKKLLLDNFNLVSEIETHENKLESLSKMEQVV